MLNLTLKIMLNLGSEALIQTSLRRLCIRSRVCGETTNITKLKKHIGTWIIYPQIKFIQFGRHDYEILMIFKSRFLLTQIIQNIFFALCLYS